MRQILQDLSKGTTYLAETPAPITGRGDLLIETSVSLISAGTERMLVEFGRASLLAKARQQPDRIKAVLDKAKTYGLLNTIDAVRSKLGQPIPLGYSNVGVVREVGAGVEGFKVGDRVVSNGSHAEVVHVPQNLCATIPDGVDDNDAAFTVVASIGLQGIRLAAPSLGEAFVVTGAGLIGLLTIQLLRAHGCRVLAIDVDADKLALAARFGAETCNLALGGDAVAAGLAISGGRGVDGVLITASTTSNDPVTQAARMCRKRGRIVLVGVAGLELERADFYEKELSFQVSCSYGPGRYDPAYEQGGHDYPFGFVRFTAQRNFEAILAMMAERRIDVVPLISRRIAFAEAPTAYDILSSDKTALGLLLEYRTDGQTATFAREVTLGPAHVAAPNRPVLGFVGAGNYASRMLIPAFRKAGARLGTVVTTGGLSGVIHGKPAGFAKASTNLNAMLADPAIDTAVIVTRHNSHADLVVKALRAGKHVFVEKPLAITLDELDRVRQAYEVTDRLLMVGFNRRFAPQVRRMKRLLDGVVEPKSFVVTMNAGAIPVSHWTQDPAVGGGRIIGEACHMIDLVRHLAGFPIVSVQARRIGPTPTLQVTEDKAAILLGFADGSLAAIHYLANGAASFPKERVEVFCAGRVLQLDNFRKLRGFGWPKFGGMNLWRQDKGQNDCAAAFLAALAEGRASPIAPNELFEVARVSIEIAGMLRTQL